MEAAFDSEDRYVKLFHLFLTRDYLVMVSKFSSEVLERRGKKALQPNEFLGYIGLELGMSLVKFNSLRSYWRSGAFMGHDTFKDAMSRNRFLEIRAAVQFEATECYDAEMAHKDPLWFSRSLLEHFVRRCGAIAVPLGISALDENTCATKARTRAKTYSPNKPAKYGIRFYAVVGHKYCYLSSMFDNRSGNQTGIPAVRDFIRLFKNVKTTYFNVVGNDNSKDSLADTPSALWICMMGHQYATYKNKRYFFTDNFYTRHILAHKMYEFADKDVHLIGTVKFTNVDATNRYYLSQAMERMKDTARGSWCLVQAYHKHPDYERRRNAHRQSRSRTPFIPPLDNPAEKAGYIVFKDSKLVLFYTNDLFANPPEPITDGSDERAWECVHGLAKISRWTGEQNLHHKDFLVAAPIVAYNMFMNGVDRMDQYRSTLATERKEKRVQMTLFTFILDLAVSQGYAIYQKVCDDRNLKKRDDFFEFKRRLCESLVQGMQQSTSGRRRGRPCRNENVTITNTLGSIEEAHMLVQNIPRAKKPSHIQDVDCFLCRKMGKELKTIYSCMQCGKGFHVNCFTAFHYRGALSSSRQARLNLLLDADTKPSVGKPS